MMEKNRIQEIANEIRQKQCYLIGICGIPGAGKSTTSHLLQQHLEHSIIVPMDGFHLYRKDLDQYGMKFRGAPFTFDLHRFDHAIKQIKSKQYLPLSLPSFDHAAKDPVQNSIVITEDIKHVIVEGIYIFDHFLDLEKCWDYKIWLQTDIQRAMVRVAKRNYQAGISPTLEASIDRANLSDKKNAQYVLQHSIKTNSTIILT